jgi:hypothetical protein
LNLRYATFRLCKTEEMHMYSVHKDSARKYRPKMVLRHTSYTVYEKAFILIQI